MSVHLLMHELDLTLCVCVYGCLRERGVGVGGGWASSTVFRSVTLR